MGLMHGIDGPTFSNRRTACRRSSGDTSSVPRALQAQEVCPTWGVQLLADKPVGAQGVISMTNMPALQSLERITSLQAEDRAVSLFKRPMQTRAPGAPVVHAVDVWQGHHAARPLQRHPQKVGQLQRGVMGKGSRCG